VLNSRRWLTHAMVVAAAAAVAAVPLAARHADPLLAGAVGTDGAPLVITAVQGVVPVSAQVTPPPAASRPHMAWPLTGVLTQGFGPSPYWFEPSVKVGNTTYPHFHTGIDIAVPWGAPVRAPLAGRVEYVGWQGGYGNTVVLLHDNGLRTLYAHLSRWTVARGQQVTQGEQIALAGATGNATGPHLHFEVRPEPQTVADPMAYLDATEALDTHAVPVQWGPTPGSTR
jgi:murein DD-endopeptidase MepM/ murein hydrolase activator NlpD